MGKEGGEMNKITFDSSKVIDGTVRGKDHEK